MLHIYTLGHLALGRGLRRAGEPVGDLEVLGCAGSPAHAASSLLQLGIGTTKHVRAVVGAVHLLSAGVAAGKSEPPRWLAAGTRSQRASGQALHAPGSGRYTYTRGGPSWSGSEAPRLGMWPS